MLIKWCSAGNNTELKLTWTSSVLNTWTRQKISTVITVHPETINNQSSNQSCTTCWELESLHHSCLVPHMVNCLSWIMSCFCRMLQYLCENYIIYWVTATNVFSEVTVTFDLSVLISSSLLLLTWRHSLGVSVGQTTLLFWQKSPYDSWLVRIFHFCITIFILIGKKYQVSPDDVTFVPPHHLTAFSHSLLYKRYIFKQETFKELNMFCLL